MNPQYTCFHDIPMVHHTLTPSPTEEFCCEYIHTTDVHYMYFMIDGNFTNKFLHFITTSIAHSTSYIFLRLLFFSQSTNWQIFILLHWRLQTYVRIQTCDLDFMITLFYTILYFTMNSQYRYTHGIPAVYHTLTRECIYKLAVLLCQAWVALKEDNENVTYLGIMIEWTRSGILEMKQECWINFMHEAFGLDISAVNEKATTDEAKT